MQGVIIMTCWYRLICPQHSSNGNNLSKAHLSCLNAPGMPNMVNWISGREFRHASHRGPCPNNAAKFAFTFRRGQVDVSAKIGRLALSESHEVTDPCDSIQQFFAVPKGQLRVKGWWLSPTIPQHRSQLPPGWISLTEYWSKNQAYCPWPHPASWLHSSDSIPAV